VVKLCKSIDAHQINNDIVKFGQNRAFNYACRFMRQITRGFMRKTVNLRVELVSDVILGNEWPRHSILAPSNETARQDGFPASSQGRGKVAC
jgi:hypothetical protein